MADRAWLAGDACGQLLALCSQSIGMALLDVSTGRVLDATDTFTDLTALHVDEVFLAAVTAEHRGLLEDLISAASPDVWTSAVVTWRADRAGPSADRRISVRAGECGVLTAVERAVAIDTHVHERLLAINEELAEAHRQLRSSQLVIRKLEGLLPVCAWCHRVRSDDDTTWLDLEEYLVRNDAVQLTHSICPRCSEQVRAGDV